jgi:hypothetical protein
MFRRFCDGRHRHRVEAAGLALSARAVSRLAQVQEPGSTCSEAGRRGLGQKAMALKRLNQAIATLSADRRRDVYIFIAGIIFLTVVYFLARFAEPWLN